MNQCEQSPVDTTLGTVMGQLSSRAITDETLFSVGYLPAVADTPLFSCNTINKHNTALKMEQMENTTIHEYLIDQILGMVAWDYKRHYSWVIQGQMHHSIMDLHYCVDETGIVGLNAQKVHRIFGIYLLPAAEDFLFSVSFSDLML